MRWAWRKVVGSDFGVRSLLREFGNELTIAGADLCDVVGAFGHHRGDPAFVAHEAVDAAEVAAGAHRARIVMRQMVEQFRCELAHDRNLAAIGSERKR